MARSRRPGSIIWWLTPWVASCREMLATAACTRSRGFRADASGRMRSMDRTSTNRTSILLCQIAETTPAGNSREANHASSADRLAPITRRRRRLARRPDGTDKQKTAIRSRRSSRGSCTPWPPACHTGCGAANVERVSGPRFTPPPSTARQAGPRSPRHPRAGGRPARASGSERACGPPRGRLPQRRRSPAAGSPASARGRPWSAWSRVTKSTLPAVPLARVGQ